MKKNLMVVAGLLTILFCSPAFAQFDVDWGTSNDTGNFGFDDLGQWLFDNGYAASQSAGADFAKTGYVGHNGPDSDPFSFDPGSATFEVVQSLAGNSNLTSFGFYTGSGVGKSLTEVLGAGSAGPSDSSAGSDWGVYINTPKWFQGDQYVNWFTGRAENDADQTGGSDQNAGGDPQGLIYKLNSNQYLVAWEDVDYTNQNPGNGGDRDFNDAYLKITLKDGGPTVNPEPISSALFALGGGAMAYNARRKKKKSL